jgi:zinc protease
VHVKRTILVLAGLLGSALCVAQQAGQGPGLPPDSPAPESIKGVELKGKAPVNPQTLRVVLPKPQETTLPNGLRIALLEDHKLPMFSMQLIVGGGGLADPADKRGLAMATAALLREGTQQRTSRDIAEQLATLGASLSAAASPSSGESSVLLTGLSENADQILALAADVIRNPSFPQAEVDKFKSRFLSRVEYQRSLPGFIAQEQFMRAVYGDHPGSYVVPTEAVLKGFTRAELAAYHEAYYRPNNIIVIAHGDLTLKDAIAKLERAFGSWTKGADRKVALPALAPPGKARVLLVDRPGSVQTSLWLGSLGIERNSEDYFAVLVMNHILGGGPASRLFVNLREDKGYTYGVQSTFTGSTFPGVMVASTDVRTDVTEGAMKEMLAEISRLSAEPVSPSELQDAKRALVGRFALSLDSPQTLTANLATQKIYRLPPDYWDTYPARVEAITAADIQRVAKKYYDASRLQIVAVGDGTQVRKTLEKYGTVETPGAAL